MPFGIHTAPAIFQSVIDQILRNTKGLAYIDDIIVGGKNMEECKNNLYEVMEKLNSHNVKINANKSVFYKSRIEYLGHTITSNGIHPIESKVEAIVKVPRPENISQLQAYLGLLNYYHRFLPSVSTVLYPLYQLLRKEKKFEWTKSCNESFEKSKRLICENRMLVPYDPDKPLVLQVDASPCGVGAILSHIINNVEKPIMFASVSLSEAQKNYAQVHREALAVVFGVKKFHNYLYGRRFKLVTDNSGVKEIFNPTKGTSRIAVARLQRWSLILSNYEYTIEHRAGKSMSNVDALSRLPLSEENMIEDTNPKELVSDNGPPFNSEAFKVFLESHKVKVTKSPPYHPQSNGLAERG
uniref:Reverse transcriptase domain-containing protein n=1 Tax=Anopheles minimus TaxID=112268 RepID=A0A182VPQ4_9DIPT